MSEEGLLSDSTDAVVLEATLASSIFALSVVDQAVVVVAASIMVHIAARVLVLKFFFIFLRFRSFDTFDGAKVVIIFCNGI